MLGCCEQSVLHCSVMLPELQEKQRNQFAEHGIGLERRSAPSDPRGKSQPNKKNRTGRNLKCEA
jgi:hypothetical protein